MTVDPAPPPTADGQRVVEAGAPPGDARSEAARVEAASASFKKELGLRDLVLQQIVYVVGVIWVGTAAKLGQSHIVFWLLAMLLFYVPQVAVVVHLSRAMPLEGGLYQWAKLGFGEVAGFMVAWNLWMYAVVLISVLGLTVATNLSYAFGISWMASSKPFITFVNCAVLGVLMALAVLGLGVSKWLHNAGSVMLILAFAVLIALPFVQWSRGQLADYRPFAVAMPAVSLLSLNIFGKLALGALSGFEYVAVLAGECKDPQRTIGRATVIAAPIIAVMFILGTSSVLAFNRPEDVDLIGPIPQALRTALGTSGAAAFVAPFAILLLTSRTIANSSIVFTGNTRMPMVAGWDRLLPSWFTRLHPRFRTPANSILFVGAVSLAFGLAGIIGVGEQEAFQLLENAAGILYGLTYLVLFALPLFAARRHAMPAASRRLKVAAGAGLLTTLLYVVLSIFPIIDVPSWLIFAAKISGVVVALNVLGVAVYMLAGRRRAREAVLAVIVLTAGASHVAGAQADTTRRRDSAATVFTSCDSVLLKARVDSVITEVRGFLTRTDRGELSPRARTLFAHLLLSRLELPRPLQLPVFSAGPVRLRMLRLERLEGDGPSTRAPALYAIYNFRVVRSGGWRVDSVHIETPSLAPGFDSSIVRAVVAAAADSAMIPIFKEMRRDRISFQLRLTSGVADGRIRVPPMTFFSAAFPRVRLTDAHADPGNLPAEYPLLERLNGGDGEVLVRVVIDIGGTPVMATAEVLHATSPLFALSAIRALAGYRFSPAHVDGCPVPQVLEIPFWFSLRP